MQRTGWLLTLGVMLALHTNALASQPLRFAVVIGSNQGQPDEETLLFAERDAIRMAEVLTNLGNVKPENLVLLRGPDAPTVQRVLANVGHRITKAQASTPNQKTVLLVYYSGHAGVQNLHLGSTQLGFQQLTEQVKQAGATINVVVVDACRSGGLTRVKGGFRSKPFEIRGENRLDSQGLAIISSAAAGEDAQESDTLQGGVFTHHFVMAMRGAADQSQDRQVTLSEAYKYAYEQTIRTTSRTQFIQHPTYSFRVKGREEFVLTHLQTNHNTGRLQLREPGAYLVMEREDTGVVVGEFNATGATRLVLPPGTYWVRRRSGRAVFEGQTTIQKGADTFLAAHQMRRIPYGRTIRKGHALESRSAWSLSTGSDLSGAVVPKTSLMGYGAVGLQADLESVSVQARLRYGYGQGDNSALSMGQHGLGLDATVYKLFDIPNVAVSMGLGIRLGCEWMRQVFQTEGAANDKDSLLWRMAPTARMDIALTAATFITLEGGADIVLLNLSDAGGSRSDWSTQVVPFASVGVGMYLP